MSREVINVGAAPNDGQGDPIRTSFIKTNNNFGELYARAQENPPGTLIGSVGDQAGMYAYDSNYFYYCYQDYDGSSVIWAEIPNTVLDAIEIRNGTSTVSIPTANGNITVNVANVANVAVFSSGGANFTAITASSAVINGDLTVTGNATLSGNIVGDRITNGTTSIEIPAANGNATVTVGNIANVAVFTTSGMVGNIISATGNVVGQNITTAGQVSATGNITGGNILTSANIAGAILSASANLVGGNLVIPTGARIRGDFTSAGFQGRSVLQTSNNSANATTIISAVPGENNANTLTAGFGAWSNADLSNAAIFGVYSYANQGAVRSLAVGTANANPIVFLFDATEVARFSTGGNLGIANTAPVDPLAVTGTAYVSGNITGGNIVTAGTVSAAALTVNGTSTFAGNLMPAANITYDIGNATSRWNDIWLANSTIHLGNAQISANASAINLTSPAGGSMYIAGANANIVTSGTITGANITTGGGVTATGNIFTNANFIGNGSGLTGVIAVGNVGAASQFTNGTTNFNIPVADGNIIGNIGGSINLFEFSTVGFSAAGNVTAANLITGGLITATGNVISSGTFFGDGSGLSNVIANVGSASQLTSGTTGINIPVANGNIVANVAGVANLFQWSTVGFSAQGNITGGNLVTAGLASVTGNVRSGNLISLGVLSVTGNATLGNISIVGSRTINVGNNRITNVATPSSGTDAATKDYVDSVASSGFDIQDSAANTTVVSTGDTLSLLGTANQVQVAVTGSDQITFSLPSAVSISGNVTAGNYVSSGSFTATGNVSGGNINTSGIVSVVGNVIAGNLTVGTGNVSVGNILNNNANGVGNIGTTTTRFDTVFALASSAQYADLAEYYLADRPYAAGTVVAFGGSQELTICDQDHDVTVAGIISDRPAFEMNAGITGDHPVALALAGRVPCCVIGPVRRGQMLVSAGQGRARAESDPSMGAVIGKALQDFDGATGIIEVVVGRI